MSRGSKRARAYAFLDLSLGIIVGGAIAAIWGFATGTGYGVYGLLSILFFGTIYVMGAVRLGASPVGYLKSLGRPVQEGLEQDAQDNPPA